MAINTSPAGRGEFRFATPRAGLFSAETFRNKPLKFSNINGLAVFEGDIVLGKVADLQEAQEGIAIRGFRWPNGVVIYRIDNSLPDQQRVTNALQHWMDKTNIRFRERTKERDFVTFQPGEGCSSNVGMQGGEQFVTLGPNCSLGNVIHEIGHTVGLWHEQSRADRDRFISIDFTNIVEAAIHNFDQHVTDGDDIGNYDYGSIMHYPANAFAKDPSRPTIVTPHAEPIGQRTGLSPDDIAAVRAMYP
jgi:hypothetical protein